MALGGARWPSVTVGFGDHFWMIVALSDREGYHACCSWYRGLSRVRRQLDVGGWTLLMHSGGDGVAWCGNQQADALSNKVLLLNG